MSVWARTDVSPDGAIVGEARVSKQSIGWMERSVKDLQSISRMLDTNIPFLEDYELFVSGVANASGKLMSENSELKFGTGKPEKNE